MRPVPNLLSAIFVANPARNAKIKSGPPLGDLMIDNVLNLLFRCSHRRLTRPVSPVTKAGEPHAQTYVVCLDCGKQFEYDLKHMKIGKPIDHTHHDAVVPREAQQHPGKMKYALLAASAAVVVGAAMKGSKKQPEKPAGAPKPEPPESGPKR